MTATRSPPNPPLDRRRCLGLSGAVGLAWIAGCRPGLPAKSPQERLQDFDDLWRFVADSYAFFDEKATDWQRAREIHRPRAAAAESNRAFLHVLEDLLDELYDPHCMLNANAADSWRPVPHDLFVEDRRGAILVSAVRRSSAAARAGLRVGQEVLAVDGTPVRGAARSRLPGSLRRDDPQAQQWALLSLVGGRHGDERRFRVRDRGEERELAVPVPDGPAPEEPISARVLEHRLGYLRIGSFSEERFVAEVDRALQELRDTPAMIVDVRSNAGGDTAVARPIMGRFITERLQYAWMARRQGRLLGSRWPEYVEPRGPWTYRGPVVVLVDRFSVSMAEGFAMGMQGMRDACLVGTRMAGLGAAIGRVTLPFSGISAQISTEPVYHVNGTPRWRLVPDIEVDVLTDATEDPILEAGKAEARRRASRSVEPTER